MDYLAAIMFEVTSLENRLSIKKNEYQQAIKNGAKLDELKTIFLEVKIIQEKLNLTKDIISAMQKTQSIK